MKFCFQISRLWLSKVEQCTNNSAKIKMRVFVILLILCGLMASLNAYKLQPKTEDQTADIELVRPELEHPDQDEVTLIRVRRASRGRARPRPRPRPKPKSSSKSKPKSRPRPRPHSVRIPVPKVHVHGHVGVHVHN